MECFVFGDSCKILFTPPKLGGVAHFIRSANADIQKQDILIENKGKPGIYRWINLTNGNTYIGSGKDLSKRIRHYYSISHLEKSNMVKPEGFLKYGYSNFSLERIIPMGLFKLISIRNEFFWNIRLRVI